MFVVRTRQVRHIYDCDVQSVATKRIKDCEFLKVHGKTIYIYCQPAEYDYPMFHPSPTVLKS